MVGNGEVQFLAAPGYPDADADPESTYPDNAYCEWTYPGNDDTFFGMMFLEMVVEFGENMSNETCENDYVYISITGRPWGEQAGRRFCGYPEPEDPVMGRGKVQVIFETNERRNFRGWRAAYNIKNDFDPCERNRCKTESSVCIADTDGIKPKCDCFPGYTGERCDTDIIECDSNPCQNGGKCDDSQQLDHYVCDCPMAWEGYNCDQARPLECTKEPCFNDGNCKDLPEFTYECTCGEFYEGEHCETEIGCESPGVDGYEDDDRFHFGTSLEFDCREGWILIGDTTVTCMDDKTWSTSVPECVVNESWITPPPAVDPFVGSIAILSLLFAINAVVFGLYMKYRGIGVNWRKGDVENPEDEDEDKEDSPSRATSAMSDDVFEDDDDYDSEYDN